MDEILQLADTVPENRIVLWVMEYSSWPAQSQNIGNVPCVVKYSNWPAQSQKIELSVGYGILQLAGTVSENRNVLWLSYILSDPHNPRSINVPWIIRYSTWPTLIPENRNLLCVILCFI